MASNRAFQYSVKLIDRNLQFSASPLSDLHAPVQVQVALSAVDFMLAGEIPKVSTEFLAYIVEELDRLGGKRLLEVDESQVEALEAQGYKRCDPSAMTLISKADLERCLSELEKDSKRKAHFEAYETKLKSQEWRFVFGSGPEFAKNVSLDALTEFFANHCSYACGGLKTEHGTYTAAGIAARFFYPDEQVKSFALLASDGSVLAANHLMLSGKLAYCYDNVVHQDYRSKSVDDAQHVYQFFLRQIAVVVAKETFEKIAIILGADGSNGKGQHLRELLSGSDSKPAKTVLMFKGGAPEPELIRLIEIEKLKALEVVQKNSPMPTL